MWQAIPAGAFAVTEPHTGSDAANIRTTAVRERGNYILNGTKSLITSGEAAGVTVGLGRYGPQCQERQGNERIRG